MTNLTNNSNYLGWETSLNSHSLHQVSHSNYPTSPGHEEQRFFISPGWGALGWGWGVGGGYPYWGHRPRPRYYREDNRNFSTRPHPGMISGSVNVNYSIPYGKNYHGHHHHHKHQGHHHGRPHSNHASYWGYWNPKWGKYPY